MKADAYDVLPVVVLTEAQLLEIRGGGDDSTITTKGSQCSNLNCSNCGKCNKCDKCDGCSTPAKNSSLCYALTNIFCS